MTLLQMPKIDKHKYTNLFIFTVFLLLISDANRFSGKYYFVLWLGSDAK